MSDQDSFIPVSQLVDGFRIPLHFSAKNFRSSVQYKPQPEDVFIVTYPKCGTTWTQYIVLLIFRKGRPLESHDILQTYSPFLDREGSRSINEIPRPGAIKTHLPFHLAPWSNEAKYIYVARNPKDCCVSYFHHITSSRPYFRGSFDEYFEFFMSGNIEYGDYFDHLLGWYEHRNDPNVCFLTYEELQEDIDSAILKMASFLDEEKYAKPIRGDLDMMSNIKKYSSFEFLKESVNKAEREQSKVFSTDIKKERPSRIKNYPFPKSDGEKVTKDVSHPGHMRRGIVGDWKNYFSEEQSRRLDEKCANKLQVLDLYNFWLKYM